jgi:hypothetical protein
MRSIKKVFAILAFSLAAGAHAQTTGEGQVVLQNKPTINSPTITGATLDGSNLGAANASSLTVTGAVTAGSVAAPTVSASSVSVSGNVAAASVTSAGDITAVGNVNVKGSLSSTANTQPASPTNSGVALGASPTWAIASFYDQSSTANNRTVQILNINGGMYFRFVNDAGSGAVNFMSVLGGSASGVTGIASTSGSGAWAHTGTFSATGDIASAGTLYATIAGGNSVALNGAASGGTPTLSTIGVNNNIGLNITPKGAGGINLNSNTAVAGTMSVSGTLLANTGTVNVYSDSGTPVTTPHMVMGSVTLASGAGTATFTGGAIFSSTTSYNCTATDTTTNSAVKVTPASASTVSFSGATTDTIAYQCVGN